MHRIILISEKDLCICAIQGWKRFEKKSGIHFVSHIGCSSGAVPLESFRQGRRYISHEASHVWKMDCRRRYIYFDKSWSTVARLFIFELSIRQVSICTSYDTIYRMVVEILLTTEDEELLWYAPQAKENQTCDQERLGIWEIHCSITYACLTAESCHSVLYSAPWENILQQQCPVVKSKEDIDHLVGPKNEFLISIKNPEKLQEKRVEWHSWSTGISKVKTGRSKVTSGK